MRGTTKSGLGNLEPENRGGVWLVELSSCGRPATAGGVLVNLLPGVVWGLVHRQGPIGRSSVPLLFLVPAVRPVFNHTTMEGQRRKSWHCKTHLDRS